MLEITGIKKNFGDLQVLKGVDLKVEKGDVVAILGPSGSGKTTFLRCINFLETTDQGTMVFDGESFDMSRVSRKDMARIRRKTAFVFQNFNLFLNKTALENVTEGLIVARKIPRAQAEETGRRALDKVGLSDRWNYYPHQLSGGQQQRVALARAIVIHPDVLLMDEPLCNLDAKLRVTMRTGIKKIQKQLNITTIYVTHDQEEALSISDRIAVIHDGQVEQVGEPKEIYTRPANMFVANFIGTSSFLDGTAKGGEVTVLGKKKMAFPMDKDFEGAVKVSIRPEYVLLDAPKEGEIQGTITLATFLGDFMNYEIELENKQIIEINEYTDRMDNVRRVGDSVSLNLMENRISIFDAKTEKSLMI